MLLNLEWPFVLTPSARYFFHVDPGIIASAEDTISDRECNAHLAFGDAHPDASYYTNFRHIIAWDREGDSINVLANWALNAI